MTLVQKIFAGLVGPMIWAQAVGAATLANWKFDEISPDTQITVATSDNISLSAPAKHAPVSVAAFPPGTQLKGSALFNKAEKSFLTSESVVEGFNFKENQPFTIEGWFFLSTLPSEKDQPHIFCNRSGLNNENIGVAILATYNETQPTKADLRFFFDGGGIGKQAIVKAEAALEAQTWYHFQAVREDDGTLRLFLNGIEADGSGKSKIPVAVNSDAPVTIGRSMLSGEGAVFFDGYIAEIKVSDEAILGN